MVATYIKKIMRNMNCATLVCFQLGRQFTCLCSVRCLRLSKRLTLIFPETIHVMNIKLCMVVLHTELYLFITLSVILTLFEGHTSVKEF